MKPGIWPEQTNLGMVFAVVWTSCSPRTVVGWTAHSQGGCRGGINPCCQKFPGSHAVEPGDVTCSGQDLAERSASQPDRYTVITNILVQSSAPIVTHSYYTPVALSICSRFKSTVIFSERITPRSACLALRNRLLLNPNSPTWTSESLLPPSPHQPSPDHLPLCNKLSPVHPLLAASTRSLSLDLDHGARLWPRLQRKTWPRTTANSTLRSGCGSGRST